jgi:uncharacterized repeat protein (TIGR01451 family)
MTADLVTLTKEQRAFSKNRDLMPAATLKALKKIAFTLLCCTVLMVSAAAQTLQQIKADPGNNDPPPPGAIRDLSGTLIPGGGTNTNTYQQYTVNFTATSATTTITFAFREDPAFISFSKASVTDVSTPSGELLTNGNFAGATGINNPTGWTYANVFGAFAGGMVEANCGVGSGDFSGLYGYGNCWYDGAVQAYDAISQIIATNVGDNYLISFWVADNSGCRTEPVETPCNFSDLSTNGNTTGTGGNGINVTVYAQPGLPPAPGPPLDPANPATFSQSFVLSNVTNQQVAADYNFLTALNAGTLIDYTGVVPYVGFSGMTQAEYKANVKGTALDGTSCLTALGLTDSTGHPLCVGTSYLATIPGVAVPSGQYLPQSNARNIVLTQTLDLDPNQGGPVSPPNPSTPAMLNIPAGFAPVVPEFNDVGACGFASLDPLNNDVCPRSIGTSIKDGPTKPGGSGRPVGSTTTFACCEPLWTTVPTIAPWTNQTTSIPVSFLSTPPTPAPTSTFHAAQGQGVSFGAVTPASLPVDPVVPFPTETTAPNLTQTTGCPNSPDWTQQVPIAYNSAGTISSYDNNGIAAGALLEGPYYLLYAPLDCDEFLGLQYPLSINLGGDGTSPNLAAWNKVPFNVDLTNPTVGPITLTPAAPGGYYAQGASLTASFACNDPLGSGGVAASGIKFCGPGLTNNGGTNPVSVTNYPVPTSTIGPQTFTASAMDVAGNSASTTSSVPYTVVGNADLGIGMFGNFLVKAGHTITYYMLVANAGPSTAYGAVVNDTLPANTSFVSANYSICVTLKCLLSPPINSCLSTSGSCTIGNLPAWTPKNPVVAEVQITVMVNTNVQPKTTIKNTATVGGVASADPNLKNNTATWSTLVTK